MYGLQSGMQAAKTGVGKGPYPEAGQLSMSERVQAQVELAKALKDLEKVSGDVAIEGSTAKREYNRLFGQMLSASARVEAAGTAARGTVESADIRRRAALVESWNNEIVQPGGSGYLPTGADLDPKLRETAVSLGRRIDPATQQPRPDEMSSFMQELNAELRRVVAKDPAQVRAFINEVEQSTGASVIDIRNKALPNDQRLFDQLEEAGRKEYLKREKRQDEVREDIKRENASRPMYPGGSGATQDLIDRFLADGEIDPTLVGAAQQEVQSALPGYDPAGTRGQLEKLLKQLEEPNPGPAIERYKQAIMEDPRFDQYMEMRGLTDRESAFKLMLRETAVQQKQAERQSKKQIRAGKRAGKYADAEFTDLLTADAPAEPREASAASDLTEGSGRDTGAGVGDEPVETTSSEGTAPKPTEPDTPEIPKAPLEAGAEEPEAEVDEEAEVDKEAEEVDDVLSQRGREYKTMQGERLGLSEKEEDRAIRKSDRAMRKAKRAGAQGERQVTADVRREDEVGETPRSELAGLVPSDPDVSAGGPAETPLDVYERYRDEQQGGRVEAEQSEIFRTAQEDAERRGEARELTAEEAQRAQQQELHKLLEAERKRRAEAQQGA